MDYTGYDSGMRSPLPAFHPKSAPWYAPFAGRPAASHPHCDYTPKILTLSYVRCMGATRVYFTGDVGAFLEDIKRFGGEMVDGRWEMEQEQAWALFDELHAQEDRRRA